MSEPNDFFKLVRSSFRFNLFLLAKLPAAFISGVRVREINAQQCAVTVPFKWLSQNPFKSTYFACLAMAAEMSTGVLALAQVYKRTPAVSMLVRNIEAEFLKKAVGRTRFVCEDGDLIQQTVEDAIRYGEAKTVTALSTGRNEAGEVVAVFKITWGFKVRSAS